MCVVAVCELNKSLARLIVGQNGLSYRLIFVANLAVYSEAGEYVVAELGNYSVDSLVISPALGASLDFGKVKTVADVVYFAFLDSEFKRTGIGLLTFGLKSILYHCAVKIIRNFGYCKLEGLLSGIHFAGLFDNDLERQLDPHIFVLKSRHHDMSASIALDVVLIIRLITVGSMSGGRVVGVVVLGSL